MHTFGSVSTNAGNQSSASMPRHGPRVAKACSQWFCKRCWGKLVVSIAAPEVRIGENASCTPAHIVSRTSATNFEKVRRRREGDVAGASLWHNVSLHSPLASQWQCPPARRCNAHQGVWLHLGVGGLASSTGLRPALHGTQADFFPREYSALGKRHGFKLSGSFTL